MLFFDVASRGCVRKLNCNIVCHVVNIIKQDTLTNFVNYNNCKYLFFICSAPCTRSTHCIRVLMYSDRLKFFCQSKETGIRDLKSRGPNL